MIVIEKTITPSSMTVSVLASLQVVVIKQSVSDENTEKGFV